MKIRLLLIAVAGTALMASMAYADLEDLDVVGTEEVEGALNKVNINPAGATSIK